MRLDHLLSKEQLARRVRPWGWVRGVHVGVDQASVLVHRRSLVERRLVGLVTHVLPVSTPVPLLVGGAVEGGTGDWD